MDLTVLFVYSAKYFLTKKNTRLYNKDRFGHISNKEDSEWKRDRSQKR